MELPNQIADDYFATFTQEPPRPHMGVSEIGHPCRRKLWLSFRWAVVETFPGRILSLFRRGQMEEIVVVNTLRKAGYKVTEALEEQKYIDLGCHVGGSPDGVISGITSKDHILEIKTHSKKSFDDVKKNGVEKSKPMHWCQMQVYMLGRGLERALYFPVCKDDDRVEPERVRLDKEYAEGMVKRAQEIAISDRMPEPLSTDESWYECKFCPAHEFCFGDKKPLINCRTCAHSTAREDSTWFCERWQATIPTDAQREGCRSHVIHPDLLRDVKIEEADEWNVKYNGVLVGEDGVSSQEYIEFGVEAIANMFGGWVK